MTQSIKEKEEKQIKEKEEKKKQQQEIKDKKEILKQEKAIRKAEIEVLKLEMREKHKLDVKAVTLKHGQNSGDIVLPLQ